jgi:hypothetical protein
MTAPASIALDPVMRGDPFVMSFVLGNSWTSSMFTGGLKWTLRTREPSESVVTDTDAIAQATTTDGEITFSTTTAGSVSLPSSETTTWPAGRKHWDLQATVSGVVPRSYTIARGTIVIIADITRAP